MIVVKRNSKLLLFESFFTCPSGPNQRGAYPDRNGNRVFNHTFFKENYELRQRVSKRKTICTTPKPRSIRLGAPFVQLLVQISLLLS